MKYLMIQNTGVAPIQSFTVLGLSTARGNADKIGQFGSGSKHAINLLLRNNLKPVIYLGNDCLDFSTRTDYMGDRKFEQVVYNFRGECKDLGFALEYGEMDWNSIGMALREIISNAIDSVGSDNVIMDIVDDIVPHDNHTTIYLPATQEITEYVKNIGKYFLHFSDASAKCGVLTKTEPGPVKIYRKGVFVRQSSSPYNSLFDYNMGEGSKIDESRNMSETTVREEAAKLLFSDLDASKAYIKACISSENRFWECDLASWNIPSSSNKLILAAKELHGDAYYTDSQKVYASAKSLGHNVILVKHGFPLLSYFLKNADDCLNRAQKEGLQTFPASAETKKCLTRVWTKLGNAGMTRNKVKPNVMEFADTSTNGEEVMGYYDDSNKTVYINRDYVGVNVVMLEECAHYITGAADFTREFQNFAFSVACLFGFR